MAKEVDTARQTRNNAPVVDMMTAPPGTLLSSDEAIEQCAIRSGAMYHLLAQTPPGERFAAGRGEVDLRVGPLQPVLAEWQKRVTQVREFVAAGGMPGQENILVNWNAGAQEVLNQLDKHEIHYQSAMAQAADLPPGPSRNLYIHNFILAPLLGGGRHKEIGNPATPWVMTTNDWCLPIQLGRLLDVGYDEDDYMTAFKNMALSLDPREVPAWWYDQFEAMGLRAREWLAKKKAEIAAPYEARIKAGFVFVAAIALFSLFSKRK